MIAMSVRWDVQQFQLMLKITALFEKSKYPILNQQTEGKVLYHMAEIIEKAEEFGGKPTDIEPKDSISKNQVLIGTIIIFDEKTKISGFINEVSKMLKQG